VLLKMASDSEGLRQGVSKEEAANIS